MPPATQSAIPGTYGDEKEALDVRLCQTIAMRMMGMLDTSGGDSAAATRELNKLRKLCREGNPFPLIAKQWPEMVIPPDHRHAKIFTESNKQIADQPIIDELKEVCLDPSNPILRLDWWQYVVLAGVFCDRIGEVALAGSTGCGKGASSCLAVNVWYDAFEDARIHLTGPNFERCASNVFGEVVKWRQQQLNPAPANVAGTALAHPKNPKRRYITILNPDVNAKQGADEKFSGAHGDHTMFLFDEATVHPSSWIENARRPANTIFALANPRSLSGWFHDMFKGMTEDFCMEVVPGKKRLLLRMCIGGEHCLNVRYQRLKIPVAPKGGMVIDEQLHPAWT